MKSTRVQVRQGDVLLTPVNATPKGARAVRDDRVLAYGEATGHAHVLDKPGTLFNVGGRMFVEVKTPDVFLRQTSPTPMDPDLHKPILLVPGLYEVIVEKQYTPGPVPVQQVMD